MKTKIVLLVSLIIFAMTSCSNVVEDSDEMTLEINFGQKSLPATIQYKIDIEGPKTFTHESTGTQPVLVKVPMGYYNISVTAFSDYRGGTVYATGDGQVTVNARYNSIPITLNIIGGAATPEAIPGAGTYTGPQNITLFTTTAGAAIYYTLDGSEPSSTSTKYTGSITISALGITTLKAIAIMSGMYDSLLLEAEYNILAVDKPEVNVPEGEVPYGTTITLNTATTGAEIRYTLDGSDPNSSCTLYTSPFTLNTLGSVTLKAIAIKAGIENSDILVAAYTVIPVGTVTKPTAAPSEGVIISGTTVELSTTTAGAEIWYTTNGVTPAKNVGTKYTTPILITVDTIIKAIAVKEGMTDSNISEITYTAKAAKPTASPGNGEVNYGTAVTLSTTTAGANIYYTTDGTTPTASSSLYSGQIVLDMNFGSVTLRAIAIKDGIISNILQAEYIILPLGEVAKPNATPSGGIVISGTTITLSTTTAGAEIRYTTNGVTPAKNVGTKYTTPILITADTIIKAIAVKEGMTDSNISEIIYTAKAAKPAASLSGSTVTYGTPVTLSTTTAGANIYYTTDGTTPTASSSLYSGQIVLDMKLGSITLKAIAVKDDMVDSDILGVAYIILPINTVATPTASPSGGGVTIGTEVTLSSTTQDAEIWYTTDDSDPIPDTVGTINYTDTNKITINDDTIIRAIAVKPGWSDSDILTTEYTILAVATPKADPPAGQVPFGTMGITLSTTTSGATIHYTRGNNTEPPTPTTSSPIYPDVPIILDNPVGTVITLKAIAVKSDMRQSDTLITSYTIISTGEVAEPVANPSGGQVISGANVTLTLSTLTDPTLTDGVEIWYTINGSNPNKNLSVGTKYTSPISISNITAVTTIRAIAFKVGMTDSTMLVIEYTPLSLEMQWIPAGKFTMGQTGLIGQFASIVATPVHEVTLTQGFYMGKYQVTQAQYAAVMGSNPSYYHGGSDREPAAGEIQGRRPVEQVSWYDALVFCNKLSLMVGLIPAYKIDSSTNPDDWGDVPTSWDEFSQWNAVEIVSGSTGYRLPTEAQWEYACRAGTTTIWFHGNEETGLGNYAWYIVNSDDRTHEVGLNPANAFGLCDMHGNVWERCWDWSGAYSSGAQTDPLGALFADTRVSRGGSWGAANCFCLSSAFRNYQNPASRTYGTGLRVVRP